MSEKFRSSHLIEACSGKIVCNPGKGAMKEILYTKDCQTEAEKLCSMISERIQEDKNYESWKIRAFVVFDVVSELRKALPDLDIQPLETQLIIRFQSPSRKTIIDGIKEVDVYMKRIMKLESCPDGAEKLITRKKVQKYAKDTLEAENVDTIIDENGSTCIVFLTKDAKKSNVKDLFKTANVVKEVIKNQACQTFLEKNNEMIYRKDINAESEYFCMIKVLESEFEKNTMFTWKTLNRAAFKFLKKFGSDLLGSFEKKYQLSLTMEDDRLYCFGRRNNDEDCLGEIEKQIYLSVAHFADGDNDIIKDTSRLVILNKIANKYMVGIQIIDACGPFLSSDKIKGIQDFAEWTFENNEVKVAVADVDFTDEKCIGVFIIPVNTAFYGKDIFSGSQDEVYLGKQFQMSREKVSVGTWKYSKLEWNKANKHCVALAIEDVGLSENKQERMFIDDEKLLKSYKAIFDNISKLGLSLISVVAPKDNTVIIRSAQTIITAFKEHFGKHAKSELIFCWKEDPEELIKTVDRCIIPRDMTRREVSPTVAGIFIQPKVKTTVAPKSLLDVGACCIVVLVSKEVKLTHGLSKIISEKAGTELQTYLDSKVKTDLKPGDLISSGSYKLKECGVHKLIFGFLPFWNKTTKMEVVVKFVEDCLMKAESMNCSSVAFPALGTANLAYPPRDVAVAMLDGIAKYSRETMIGHIKEVFIAVPNINDNDLMYQKRFNETDY